MTKKKSKTSKIKSKEGLKNSLQKETLFKKARPLWSSPKNAAITLLILVLVASQAISLAVDQKIFGINVSKVSTNQEDDKKAKFNPITEEQDLASQSLVCKTVSAEDVSRAVGQKVTPGAISADIKEPNLFSSCIYRTSAKDSDQANKRSVTISLQDKAEKSKAEEELQKFVQKGYQDLQEVSGVGDEAYYAPELSQLVIQKDRRIVSVFIDSGDKKVTEKPDIAKSLAQKLL